MPWSPPRGDGLRQQVHRPRGGPGFVRSDRRRARREHGEGAVEGRSEGEARRASDRQGASAAEYGGARVIGEQEEIRSDLWFEDCDSGILVCAV